MFGVGMDVVVEIVKVFIVDIQCICNEYVLVICEKFIFFCDLCEVLGFEVVEEREEYLIFVVLMFQGEFGLIIDKFYEGIDVI